MEPEDQDTIHEATPTEDDYTARLIALLERIEEYYDAAQ